MMYCVFWPRSPTTPWQCLTPKTAASAAVVMVGGVTWVLSAKGGAVKPKSE